jgi:hypothetical protein
VRKLFWTFSERELPNAADIEWETRRSWLFRGSPLVPLSFGLVLPLAAAGAAALAVAREWRSRVALAAPILVGVVVSVLFFTNARFRLILAPSLIVLAAVGAVRAASPRPLAEHTRPLAILAAAAVLGAGVTWSNFDGVRSYQIPEIAVNTALLEREAGHLTAAVTRLRGVTRTTPDDGAAWLQLCSTLEQAGRIDEARAAWAEAAGHRPGDPFIEQEARRFAARHP